MEERLLFDAQTLANVTIEDCEEMYKRKRFCAICNDGRLDGFIKEPEERAGKHLKLIWFNAAI